MIKQSVETRWFFAQPPMSHEELFGAKVEFTERTDWYAFPCHKSNGVKFREGRLETKLLIEDIGEQTWGNVSGRAGAWRKWAAQYVGGQPSTDVLSATGWVAVQKRRYWQSLEIRGGESRWCRERVSNGCEIEWSEVTVAGVRWFTIGFEAVGTPNLLNDNLNRAIDHALKNEPADTPFCLANSMAYPAWLWHVKSG